MKKLTIKQKATAYDWLIHHGLPEMPCGCTMRLRTSDIYDYNDDRFKLRSIRVTLAPWFCAQHRACSATFQKAVAEFVAIAELMDFEGALPDSLARALRQSIVEIIEVGRGLTDLRAEKVVDVS